MRITPEGVESRIEVAYVRGSQISFIIVPAMLQRAPFFNRIKMWRKFKGHAVYGANTAAINGPPRGVFPPRGGRGGGPRPSFGGPQSLVGQGGYYGPAAFGSGPARGPPMTGNYR